MRFRDHYANQTEPVWGEVCYVAYPWAPVGWVACDGKPYKPMDNYSLFSLLGTRYGGNGTTEFGMPQVTLPPDASGNILAVTPWSDAQYPRKYESTHGCGNSDSDAFVGEIRYFALDFIPSGWLRCDGATVSARDYPALEYLISGRFGSHEDMALPNLINDPAVPKGLIPAICGGGYFPQGSDKKAPTPDDPQLKVYIGQIIHVVFGQIPNGWWPCDGSIMPIRGCEVVFSLLGNRFGGDGRETFALPNLMNSAITPKGVTPIIALGGVYPARMG